MRPLERIAAVPSRRSAPVLRRGGRGAEPSAKLWPRPLAGDDHDAVTPRRRRPQPGRWSRRRRLLRWLKPLIWSLAIAGSPAAAVLWLYHSPRFTVQDVVVTYPESEDAGGGASGRVPEVWVRQAVAPFEGENLLRLSLAHVTGRLEVHPWVRSVGVSKELPSRLGVRVVERREAALLRDGRGDLYYVDGDGEIIAPLEGPPPSLVVVETTAPWQQPAPALALLGELEAAAPEWLDGLHLILVLETKDFALSTSDLPYLLLVRAGTVAGKVRRLRELLPDIMAHAGAGAAIDLRFEQRIIIQPSAGGAASSLLARRIAGATSGRNS